CSFVIKKSWRFKFDEVRQRFRLTPTEKRVVIFVLAAFVLGLITKCYRDAHPSPALPQSNPGKARPSAFVGATQPNQEPRLSTGVRTNGKAQRDLRPQVIGSSFR